VGREGEILRTTTDSKLCGGESTIRQDDSREEQKRKERGSTCSSLRSVEEVTPTEDDYSSYGTRDLHANWPKTNN